MITQTIVRSYPPNYSRITEVFPAVKVMNPIFSWGDVIYAPNLLANECLPGYLIAHEAVHGTRQYGSVEDWWDRYLTDVDFRLHEELLAHTAEFQHEVRRLPPGEHDKALRMVAFKLSSKLYGSMIKMADAKRLILASAKG